MSYAYDEVALECEFAECRTFGSVIRYALDLETVAAAFYKDANEKGIVKGAASEAFANFSNDHMKRKNLLEHTRREKLNEMILEPISNIDNSKYKPELKKLEELDEMAAISQAIELEEKAAEFYLNIASEAKTLLAEASRILLKLGKENQDKTAKLKSVQ